MLRSMVARRSTIVLSRITLGPMISAPGPIFTSSPSQSGPTSRASGAMSTRSPIQIPLPMSRPSSSILHAAFQHVAGGAGILLQVADIAPVALGDIAVDRVAVAHQDREEVLAEVEGLRGGSVVEHFRLQHVDAGVDGIAEHLAPAGLLQELADRAVVVGDHHAVFERIGDAGQGEGGHRAALLWYSMIAVRSIVGQRVAADHQEGLGEQVLGLLDAAGGAERHILDGVLDVHAELRAVAEIALDHPGQVLQGDHHLGDPVLLEQQQDMFHHRPADDRAPSASGRPTVKGRRRDPSPPAMTTAFIDPPLSCTVPYHRAPEPAAIGHPPPRVRSIIHHSRMALPEGRREEPGTGVPWQRFRNRRGRQAAR